MTAEAIPDDPIVEFPMDSICSTCGKVYGTKTARWPQSSIEKKKKMYPQWNGRGESHGYCPEHDPNAPSAPNTPPVPPEASAL